MTTPRHALDHPTEAPFYGDDVQHLLNQFEYSHLPPHLAEVSRPHSELAHAMAGGLFPGPELLVGLRKLIEAKDCLVRQAVEDAKAE